MKSILGIEIFNDFKEAVGKSGISLKLFKFFEKSDSNLKK